MSEGTNDTRFYQKSILGKGTKGDKLDSICVQLKIKFETVIGEVKASLFE